MLIFVSCKPGSPKLPDAPYLTTDSLNSFNVGDRFILATGENSCCFYCWQAGAGPQEGIPSSPLIKAIETAYEPADPDCAGCSSFYYTVYECVTPGTDSLVHLVIPMGEMGDSERDCSNLPADKIREEHRRVYRFSIANH